MTCIAGHLNVFEILAFYIQTLKKLIILFSAVGVIGLNTRLGCLNPVMSSDSEAQKMIDAASTTFEKMSDLEIGLPIRNYLVGSKDMKALYQAQDFFTEYAIIFLHLKFYQK